MCYGIGYLETIQQLSPKSRVLICTEDIDRKFVLEHGKRFGNFSGYVHYSVDNLIDAIARAIKGDIVMGDVPDYYYPTLKNMESFEALCQQTDLLALADHQRRSPKHIYYSVLSIMEILKVRSFAEYKKYVLNTKNMTPTVTTK